jgi:hypothetical protein
MADVTTITELKRALLDEIQALEVGSADAAAPPEVQVTYAVPPADQLRSEAIYFGPVTRTISDPEYRMTAGRRVRLNTWEVQIYVTSAILADAEAAEERAFDMASAIEDFLADYPQPAEWPTTPVDSGALYVLITGYETDHIADPEGFLRVEIVIDLEVKERLA